eukprot:scaffold3236_cov66-Cylindrotheca_fusiformis.AAC.1
MTNPVFSSIFFCKRTSVPSSQPSYDPSSIPSDLPSLAPSHYPSDAPTGVLRALFAEGGIDEKGPTRRLWSRQGGGTTDAADSTVFVGILYITSWQEAISTQRLHRLVSVTTRGYLWSLGIRQLLARPAKWQEDCAPHRNTMCMKQQKHDTLHTIIRAP